MTKKFAVVWLVLALSSIVFNAESMAADQHILGLSVAVTPPFLSCDFHHMPIYYAHDTGLAQCKRIREFRVTENAGKSRVGEMVCTDVGGLTKRTPFHSNPFLSVMIRVDGVTDMASNEVRFPRCFIRLDGRTMTVL